MKNIWILSAMLLILPACKKDEALDRCAGIICFNGGACVEGDCECTEFYTGLSCQDFKIPVSVSAQSLVLQGLPNPCRTWDSTAFSTGEPPRDADIYIQLYKNGALHYDTRPIHKVDADCNNGGCHYVQTITFDPTQLYELRIYDRDTADPDDLMYSSLFRPWDFMTRYAGSDGYPSTTGCILFELDESCSVNNNYSSFIGFGLKINDIVYGF